MALVVEALDMDPALILYPILVQLARLAGTAELDKLESWHAAYVQLRDLVAMTTRTPDGARPADRMPPGLHEAATSSLHRLTADLADELRGLS